MWAAGRQGPGSQCAVVPRLRRQWLSAENDSEAGGFASKQLLFSASKYEELLETSYNRLMGTIHPLKKLDKQDIGRKYEVAIPSSVSQTTVHSLFSKYLNLNTLTSPPITSRGFHSSGKKSIVVANR